MTVFLALLPVLIVLALSLILGLVWWMLGQLFYVTAIVVNEAVQVNYGGRVFNVNHHRSGKAAIWISTMSGLALCVGAIALSLYEYQLLAMHQHFWAGLFSQTELCNC
jgi:hypothetical protein